MDYGKDFIESARRMQEAVGSMVATMTGWEVIAVNVNVVGVNAL